MSFKQDLDELEQVLICRYEKDFRENTGKNLQITIVERFLSNKKKVIDPLLPIEVIYNAINSMIPEHMHQSAGKQITIDNQLGKQELVNLRKVFTKICVDYNHPHHEIINVLKKSYTTINTYLQQISEILDNSLRDPELFNLYNEASTEIKKIYDKRFQINNQSESYPKSALSALLDTREEYAEVD